MSPDPGYALLVLACLAGVLVTPLGLPGTLVILGSALVYGWATGFATFGWPTVVTLFAIAAAAEAVEWLAGAAGARRYGGGGRAAWLAIAGGIVGGILGAPFAFGLGAIPGALAGAFAGAFAGEWSTGRDLGRAGRVGYGALVGRAVGMAVKGAAAVAMAIVAVVTAWR